MTPFRCGTVQSIRPPRSLFHSRREREPESPPPRGLSACQYGCRWLCPRSGLYKHCGCHWLRPAHLRSKPEDACRQVFPPTNRNHDRPISLGQAGLCARAERAPGPTPYLSALRQTAIATRPRCTGARERLSGEPSAEGRHLRERATRRWRHADPALSVFQCRPNVCRRASRRKRRPCACRAASRFEGVQTHRPPHRDCLRDEDVTASLKSGAGTEFSFSLRPAYDASNFERQASGVVPKGQSPVLGWSIHALQGWGRKLVCPGGLRRSKPGNRNATPVGCREPGIRTPRRTRIGDSQTSSGPALSSTPTVLRDPRICRLLHPGPPGGRRLPRFP